MLNKNIMYLVLICCFFLGIFVLYGHILMGNDLIYMQLRMTAWAISCICYILVYTRR